MAALALNLTPDRLPLQHGLLRVSSAPKPHERDQAFGAVVDDKGDLSVVLVQAAADNGRRGLPEEALNLARGSLMLHSPIYELVAKLRTFASCERQGALGITLLRFSQPEARVEILNAGMPAVSCILPNGRTLHHRRLSGAIGQRFGEVHPYELSPLCWGSCWVLLAHGPASEADSERLPNFGARSTAGQDSNELAERFASDLPPRLHGAALLVVQSAPRQRFESGIR